MSVGAGASSEDFEDVIGTGMTSSDSAVDDEVDESDGSASGGSASGVGKGSKTGVVWTVVMDVLVLRDVDVLVNSWSD